MDLTGRVAIVTGAASGIGLAIAQSFAAAGASIVLADVDPAVEAVAGQIGRGALSVQTDVSSAESVRELIAKTEQQFGGLHVMCNNAGMGAGGTPLDATPDDLFDRLVAVNLRGVFLGMKHAIPALIRSGGGSIINVSSATALVGMPGQAAYSATKAGVLALTKSAAVEYGPRGIRVNALCPGVVETPMWQGVRRQVAEATGSDDIDRMTISRHPLGRLGRPEDLASAALFLASESSSFITGAVLPVDGGMVSR